MLVLHYDNETIYGYGYFGIRSMGNIKKDGSFSWSGSAGYYGYSKIQFYGIVYKIIELASHDNKFDQNGAYIQSTFHIQNKAVTESEYDDFDRMQDQKEDVIWSQFNVKNNSGLF